MGDGYGWISTTITLEEHQVVVRNFTLHISVRDAVVAGAWYEKLLNAQTSDIREYGADCRYVEIPFGIFRIILDERPAFAEQNIPLGNPFMRMEFEVTRGFMDRLDKLNLPVEDDYMSEEQDARWVTIRDPNDNELQFVCYSDFTPSKPKRQPPVLRAER
jgi:hypothetical protein